MNTGKREIVKKVVKMERDHCSVCGEMLEKIKELSGLGNYKCSCGQWHWVTNTKTGEQYYIIY